MLSAESEAEGFPQRGGLLSGRFRDPEGGLASKFVSEDNALGYVVEMTENYYPVEWSVRSGMARLKRLVLAASQKWYWHPYEGYPCDIIAGHGMCMFMAHGDTPGQRRQNRRQLMWAVEHGLCRVERLSPDHDGAARIDLETTPFASDDDMPDRYSVQIRLIPSAEIEAVRVEDEPLSPGSQHGWQSWLDSRSLMVRVNVMRKLQVGLNRITVHYKAPFEF
jgi:hypothetical protein